MRNITLTIAGLLADLPANLKGLVQLTQARAALADLDSRVGEYSWPLTLPDTRRNRRIFGVNALHPLGLNKFRQVDFPYELRCDAQIFAGTFRLTSMRGGYTGQLLGEGFSWALELGEKKLTDLRFAEIPYDGTQLPTILALGADKTDVQFPLVSFGNFYHPPVDEMQQDGSFKEVPSPAAAVLDYPLSVDDYPPGVYYVNVLRQIFTEIGWALSGRVLDEPQWREAVLTCAGADVAEAWPWGALLPAEADHGGQLQGAYSYYETDPLNTGSQYSNTAAGFDAQRDIFFLPVPTPRVVRSATRALNAPGAAYLATRPGQYSFEWEATISFWQNQVQAHSSVPGFLLSPAAAGFREVGLGLIVSRGGEGVTGGDGGLCDAANAGGLAPGQDRVLSLAQPGGTGSYSGSVAEVYLEPGDEVRLCIFAQRRALDASGNAQATRYSFFVNFSAARFACTAYTDDASESRTTLQPAAFLPALSQKEVVKAFLRQTDTVPVADATRRTVHLLSRDEQAAAAGEVLDLSALVDADAMEYTPAAGAGVGALVFTGPGNEDPLLPAGFDTVRVELGPGNGEQTVAGLFAPVAFRNYRLAGGQLVALPTCTTADALAQARSETDWDVKGQPPRLVRYTGPDPVLTVPFAAGVVPLARATWADALAWSGEAGAVATYYAGTVLLALHGHLGKVAANLTPALYRELRPGRRLQVSGAAYRLDAVNRYDLADEANTTELILLREL